ncbi:30S ribosomal protein S18 [Candidatus Saccharibacteria bacterium QS_5_54_17]|jgi:small subunit ribosomal protein S18|nr:MAG: 30S ribosomal protein S18 [Candidatus Saccharibacteria bacterium QS_5_54_17]PSO43821.1 MAG: 30S ribosomal protein S18 [Candidatus Saccharibacteria bacterium SW_7_54_9]
MVKQQPKRARDFDYKDVKTLGRYTDMFGHIESRKKTGLNEKQQHRLARAIKRARHIGLLPYSNE